MKRLFIAILAFGALLTACQSNEEFLKENLNGKLFPDNFCNDKSELDMAINAMYERWQVALLRPYESMEIKFASSDDILGTGNQRPCYNEMEINANVSVSGDDDIYEGYERAYTAINQANLIINNAHNADGKLTEESINEYIAQACVVRAYTYFWMVRFFNNMPLVTTAYEPDSKLEQTNAKASEIYELIVEDLKFAEQHLPVTWSDSRLRLGGAVTKGAAKALLSKVYLQMAGFPINGGTPYYKLAADKAKEVIDNAGTYGYKLYNHFHEIWNPYLKPFVSTEDEVIMWFAHSDEDYSVRAPFPSRPVELDGWEFWVAENGFYNRFPEGERKEFTFITDFYVMGGIHYSYKDFACAHPCYRKMWADDWSGEDWSWENHNDPSSIWMTNMETTDSWCSGRPTIVMRYADILLTYAEAKARTDGPDALAYQCLNDVRNRAYKGLGTTEASVSNLSTQDFIDTVVWERAWEFAGAEHTARWFDLVRLELVEKANTEWRDESEAKYKLVKNYTKKDYFLSIPSAEIQINPNLANNNPEFN